MANRDIIVEQDEITDIEDELQNLIEDEVTPEEETITEETTSTIPDKFKDKSIEDVIDIYSHLEKEFGRKNNEVGELRKLTDQLLQLELSAKQTQSEKDRPKPIEVDDLLDHPEAVVRSAVEDTLANNPKLQALEDALQKTRVSQCHAELASVNADWQEVVNTEDFQTWISTSPTRLKLFQEAGVQLDSTTGSELISMYKELHKEPEEGKAKTKAKRDRALKGATVEKGANEASSKKIYRRSDLINLRIRDREKWESIQDEILLAYQEGRVR
jgi:hypothetical protein